MRKNRVQLHPLDLGPGGQQTKNIIHQIPQIERGHFQSHLVVFNFGKIQQVIDDVQEIFAALDDVLGELLLVGVQPAVQQQIGHPQNAIHGRADLVAHVRQKITLGRIGQFRARRGLLQIPVRFPQLILGPLLLGEVNAHTENFAQAARFIADRHIAPADPHQAAVATVNFILVDGKPLGLPQQLGETSGQIFPGGGCFRHDGSQRGPAREFAPPEPKEVFRKPVDKDDPAGRIPANFWVITSVVQGVDSSHSRIFVQPNPGQPLKDLVVGQLVNVQGSLGATSVNANLQAITALDTTNYLYFEVAQSFSTAYTSGGSVWLPIVVTCKAGTGGSPAGGGFVRVKIQWVGPETP